MISKTATAWSRSVLGIREDLGSLTKEAKLLQPRLFFWSSSDEVGIKRLTSAYNEHLSGLVDSGVTEVEDNYLENLAFTLSERRTTLPWRSFAVASSLSDLQLALSKGLSRPVRSTHTIKLSFAFTGQGAQWKQMGAKLLVFPVFHKSLSRANQCLQSFDCKWNVIGQFTLNHDFVKILINAR